MRVLLLVLALALAGCTVDVNVTAPCQTVVLQRDTSAVSDTVLVVAVSPERCPT